MNDFRIQDIEFSRISRRILIILLVGLVIIVTILARGQNVRIFGTSQDRFIVDLARNSESNCRNYSKKIDRICQWYFLNYTPSSWEDYWFTNIEQFQNTVCETLADQGNVNKTVLAIERLMELQNFGRNRTRSDKQHGDELMSRMFYRQECINPLTNVQFQVAEVSQLIEPLVGLLRDPLTKCPRIHSLPASVYEGAIDQSKRFFLLSIVAPFYIHSSARNHGNQVSMDSQFNKHNENPLPWMYDRSKLDLTDKELDTDRSKFSGHNILIDLGSSYFLGWSFAENATGGRWFYENYKRLGIKFDRIIAYEHSPLDPKTAWDQLPDDVFPVYTLINTACTTSGKFNPWVLLKSLAKRHDHVVVKLDIDNPAIEVPLMYEMLNDSSINSLVDEVFFEHHVTVKEMLANWGGSAYKLKDSYVLFTKLRQLGIRMHSWP